MFGVRKAYRELGKSVRGMQQENDKLKAENAKLRDLMYERAHRHAIQHMTEDELRIVATNALDENAKLRDENARLRSCLSDDVDNARQIMGENAKLREDVDHLIQAVEDLHDVSLEDRLVQMENENAKLRELCKELLDLCYDAYNQECGWDDDWALAYERAKKLGVNDG